MMNFKLKVKFIQQLTRLSSTISINSANNVLTTSIPSLSSFNCNWDKVISESKQLINYSSTNFNSKCLSNQEIFKIVQQLNQLADFNHPIQEDAKRLVLNGNNSIGIRGLIVLLIAKAIGIKCYNNLTESKLVQRQYSLAEMTEMIYSAHQIHKGVINLNSKVNCDQLINNQSIGNSVSILSGDYLLANVWKGLGELRDTKVVELMAKSLSDLVEGQFIVTTESINCLKDVHSLIDYWTSINFRLNGSLLANACQSVAVLGNHNLIIQRKVYQFGLNFALALQSADEMKLFLTNQFNHNQFYPIHSAPVLMYFSSTQDDYENFKTIGGTINQRKLYEAIRSSSAIDLTRDMKNSHTIKALQLLESLPINETIKSLENILSTLVIL
ncbi:all trans-polyprenyl-diphosphate synthase PDSS2-like [Panonychus citri]|uniref:all trans-polyprenyl-diphosphate synthase PDSS2-like n=1 Tax=Panonychus citri TaxID=50023 RepID=UPI0023082E56|nr:all trans-polyprenyl-diphosphate synthase PDSS2-like [Panonychus citri]